MSSGQTVTLDKDGLAVRHGGRIGHCSIKSETATLRGSHLVFDAPTNLLLPDPIFGMREEIELTRSAYRGDQILRARSASHLGRRDDAGMLTVWYRKDESELRFALICETARRHPHRPSWIVTGLTEARLTMSAGTHHAARMPRIRYSATSSLEQLVGQSEGQLKRAAALITGGGFTMRKL